jgi:hypothetical protein
MADSRTLPMVVAVDAKGGAWGAVGVADVPIDKLRDSLRSATSLLAEAFQDIRQVGQYSLSEVSIELEVSAEGGVSLIGTAKVSGSGSITLKFSPPAAIGAKEGR